jgi:serine/threonine protein kinase
MNEINRSTSSAAMKKISKEDRLSSSRTISADTLKSRVDHTHSKQVIQSICISNSDLFVKRHDSIDLLSFLLLGYVTEQDCSQICFQILQAMVFLNKQGIILGNLGAECVFLSRIDGKPIISIDTYGDKSPIFRAPEVLKKLDYCGSADTWSLGVLCYLLLVGYPPFFAENDQKLFQNIYSGSFQFHTEFWKNSSEYAQDFISKLLVVDPLARLDLNDAMRHPFITRFNSSPKIIIRTAKQCEKLQRNVSTNSERTLARKHIKFGLSKLFTGFRNKLKL